MHGREPHGPHGSGGDRPGENGITRAAALGLAAGVAATGLRHVPPARAAGVSPDYVVDASGRGDYTNFEEAVAAATPGSLIFVRRGLYTIQTGSMNPAAGVRIVGEGYGSWIRNRDQLNKDMFLIRNDDVVIENLRIDGNGSNQIRGEGTNVAFIQCKGGKVLNCFVHDSQSYNVVGYTNCSHLVIAGNHSYNALQEGIELYASSHCIIASNVVRASANNGIFLWNAEGETGFNSVVGNTVEGCGAWGIVVADRAHDIAVTGNTVSGSGMSGISINQRCTNILVSGNVSTGNAGHGIQLDRVAGSIVSKNVSRRNALSGISANVVNGCSIAGNVSTGNGDHGIRVETQAGEAARGASVVGNICSGNGTRGAAAGVSVFGPVNGVVIADNRCTDLGTPKTQANGIGVAERASPSPKSDDIVLNCNLVEGNSGAGMAIAGDVPHAESLPYRRLVATVGPSPQAVPHGLPYTPRAVKITLLTPGSVWKAAATDGQNVYLKADAPSRQAEVLVG